MDRLEGSHPRGGLREGEGQEGDHPHDELWPRQTYPGEWPRKTETTHDNNGWNTSGLGQVRAELITDVSYPHTQLEQTFPVKGGSLVNLVGFVRE